MVYYSGYTYESLEPLMEKLCALIASADVSKFQVAVFALEFLGFVLILNFFFFSKGCSQKVRLLQVVQHQHYSSFEVAFSHCVGQKSGTHQKLKDAFVQ